MMLEIKDLFVEIEGKKIIKGLNFTMKKGEVHAIMGPNGAGKSTLAYVLMGHPLYQVTGGKILFEGEDILDLEPEIRAHKGLFLSFQYPLEIEGLSNFTFLFHALNAQRKTKGEEPLTESNFTDLLQKKMQKMQIPENFMHRSVNEGFSGGEKKRNEILQMSLLEPKLAILDETDSGLDIDALKRISEGINALRSQENSQLIITHYQRLLEYSSPDFVHVFFDGAIVESGGYDLALTLEKQGYQKWQKIKQ
jgi:Fe-S cluster assembly ATP-binding protein